jgi:hypothetical protein
MAMTFGVFIVYGQFAGLVGQKVLEERTGADLDAPFDCRNLRRIRPASGLTER